MLVEFDALGRLIKRADDNARTVTTYDEQGTITSARPYTPEENAAADRAQEQAAKLSDLAERVARLEVHVWPAQPDPATPDAPDRPRLKMSVVNFAIS